MNSLPTQYPSARAFVVALARLYSNNMLDQWRSSQSNSVLDGVKLVCDFKSERERRSARKFLEKNVGCTIFVQSPKALGVDVWWVYLDMEDVLYPPVRSNPPSVQGPFAVSSDSVSGEWKIRSGTFAAYSADKPEAEKMDSVDG